MRTFTYAVTVYANDRADADKLLEDRLEDGDERPLDERIAQARNFGFPALPFVSPMRTLLASRQIGEQPR